MEDWLKLLDYEPENVATIKPIRAEKAAQCRPPQHHLRILDRINRIIKIYMILNVQMTIASY